MPPTQRQRQKLKTRQLILDTALKLYAEKGLSQTRTIDIAKAAQISHGTVFVHFATQDALVLAAMEEFSAQVNGRLHELAAGRESLADILAAHVEGLSEFEDFYAWLVMENRLLGEQVRLRFLSIQSVVSHHISLAALREMENGTIARMPVHLLFNGWVGLLHHYLLNRDLFAPGESVLKRHGKELLTHYVRMLASAERHEDNKR